MYEKEAHRQMEEGLVHPAYDYVLKCSHTFNLLDARGAISVTERTGYLARCRNLARKIAKTFYDEREKLGFPILKVKEENHKWQIKIFYLKLVLEELPARFVTDSMNQLS